MITKEQCSKKCKRTKIILTILLIVALVLLLTVVILSVFDREEFLGKLYIKNIYIVLIGIASCLSFLMAEALIVAQIHNKFHTYTYNNNEICVYTSLRVVILFVNDVMVAKNSKAVTLTSPITYTVDSQELVLSMVTNSAYSLKIGDQFLK